MTPKDFFLQLGIIITLYMSVVALISFLFAVINKALPQVNEYAYYGDNSSLAWSMSVFIVAYPVMVYLLWLSNKYFVSFPEKRDIALKKWFTYFTIFLTALTVVIDLIVLLFTFLQGEQITLRFILKIVTVIVVALLVFWLSLKELKGELLGNTAYFKKVFSIISASIFVLIILGFVLIGSPENARLQSEDNQRVGDLSYIQDSVNSFWIEKGMLPDSLDVLNNPLNYVSVPVDPVTGESYGYKVIDDKNFEICADFKTSSKEVDAKDRMRQEPEFFKHTEGVNCFKREVQDSLIMRKESFRNI